MTALDYAALRFFMHIVRAFRREPFYFFFTKDKAAPRLNSGAALESIRTTFFAVKMNLIVLGLSHSPVFN